MNLTLDCLQVGREDYEGYVKLNITGRRIAVNFGIFKWYRTERKSEYLL